MSVATDSTIPNDVALRALAELLILGVPPERLGGLWYLADCPPENMIQLACMRQLAERWRENHG